MENKEILKYDLRELLQKFQYENLEKRKWYDIERERFYVTDNEICFNSKNVKISFGIKIDDFKNFKEIKFNKIRLNYVYFDDLDKSFRKFENQVIEIIEFINENFYKII